MKFLCDVHISYKLVKYLTSIGYYSEHVNDILNKWHTTDSEISQYADENDFVIISKDADFRNSHFIKNSPKKLIKINLGNISNKELINIFSENIHIFVSFNKNKSFLIEIDKDFISKND